VSYFPRSQEMTLEAALRDLGDADYRVRAYAAGALGSAEGRDVETAARALRKALADDRGEVRYTAAIALGELKDREAVAALCEQLEGDGDRMARQAAVIALAMIGDSAAWGRLTEALGSKLPDVRFQAAGALAELDPERARPLLERALGDPDPEVREAAASALGACGDAAAVPALVPLLADKRPVTRAEAALALVRLGDVRGLAVLADVVGGRDLDAGLGALMAALPLLRDAEDREAPEIGALREACVRVVGKFFGNYLLKVWAAGNLAALGDARGEVWLSKLGRSGRTEVRGAVDEVRAILRGEAPDGAV